MSFIQESQYEISDDLLHSHDAEEITTSDTLVKLKTITLTNLSPSPSTLRIKFDIRATVFGDSVRAQVYKNGGAVGTEDTENDTSWVTTSEDLSFSSGDTLELWGREANISNTACHVQNFRVYGKREIIKTNGFNAANS